MSKYLSDEYYKSSSHLKYCKLPSNTELMYLLLFFINRCSRFNNAFEMEFMNSFNNLTNDGCGEPCSNYYNITNFHKIICACYETSRNESKMHDLLTIKFYKLHRKANEEWHNFLPFYFWMTSKRYRKGVYLWV